MTKCIVLTTNYITDNSIPKKPILFVEYLDVNKSIRKDCIMKPKDYNTIELICTYKSFDIMYAYQNNNRNNGTLYLGYWNDGVVE